jgi:uncharacterized protein YjiS (DUF1127 family)
MHTLIDWARREYASYRQRRDAQSMCKALHELDDRVLHDIGLDRSEIESAAAEATGSANSTRALHFWT